MDVFDTTPYYSRSNAGTAYCDHNRYTFIDSRISTCVEQVPGTSCGPRGRAELRGERPTLRNRYLCHRSFPTWSALRQARGGHHVTVIEDGARPLASIWTLRYHRFFTAYSIFIKVVRASIDAIKNRWTAAFLLKSYNSSSETYRAKGCNAMWSCG